MAVEEGDDFDLLAMGRPEGQGCYCAANHMLRNIIDGINRGYDWVMMDNEAGMEHLSRRTTRDVDHLLLISDASMRGMVAAEIDGRPEQGTGDQRPQHPSDCQSRPGRADPALRAKADGMGVPLLAALPYDPLMAEFDSQGRPLVELPEDALLSRAVAEVAQKLTG